MDKDLRDLKRSVGTAENDEETRKKLIAALVSAGRRNEAEREAATMIRRRECGPNDRIKTASTAEGFEITVHYSAGGAACFAVDQRSGESTMIWHEHPMPESRWRPSEPNQELDS